MYQNFEIFAKYIENKADWRVQWGMLLKMCNNRGLKVCLKGTGIVFRCRQDAKNFFFLNRPFWGSKSLFLVKNGH